MHLRYLQSLLVALLALAALAPAAAATPTPAPGYEQFAGCPDPEGVPTIETCYRVTFSGGVLELGKVEIPITKSFTLSGGMTSAGKFVHNTKGGLSAAKQVVTGGTVGFTGQTWLLEFLGSEALRLNAVVELAGTPGNQLAEPAELPVKVHMMNSTLGNNCYLGWEGEPNFLQLLPNGGHTIYTDSTFSASGAHGCVLTLFGFPPEPLDETIDEQNELPAPEGASLAELNYKSESAPAALVYP